MIKQLYLLVFICLLANGMVQSQIVVFINAGSRAPYGTNQELTISNSGQCRYYLKEVNGPVKDSSSFSISTTQLDSLFSKADQTGFFGLNNSYPGTNVDGSGIYISMNYAGRKKRVDLRNTDIPAINELMGWVNAMLASRSIRINYGQPKQ